jgi:hypothetical protein
VNPRELGLVGLCADEASWVGDTKGADGSDVGEEGMIDGGGDETRGYVLVEVVGGREEDGIGGIERNEVSGGGNGRQTALDEKGVQGAEGVENGDGKSDGRVDDLGGFQPIKGGCGLGVGVGFIVFEVVMKDAVDDFIMVKIGVEGKIGGEV